MFFGSTYKKITPPAKYGLWYEYVQSDQYPAYAILLIICKLLHRFRNFRIRIKLKLYVYVG